MSLERLKRLARVAQAQRQMSDIARAKIARLKNEERDVLTQRENWVNGLGTDSPCHGLFMDLRAKRMDQLDGARARLAVEVERLEAELGKSLRSENAAQKLSDRLARENTDQIQRRLLEEMIAPASGKASGP